MPQTALEGQTVRLGPQFTSDSSITRDCTHSFISLLSVSAHATRLCDNRHAPQIKISGVFYTQL